jgi:proteic killer suppression protein
VAIINFGDAMTEDLAEGHNTAKARAFPAELRKIAQRKLDALAVAATLDDLRVPPGNRLEALRGKLAGHHSIRINDQWRVVFRWDGGARDVRITDYH